MIDESTLVCYCELVTEDTIIKAIKAGAKTPEEVTKKTHAGRACGSCIETIEILIENSK
ncbi:MAG: (2Fe-2S)-binding protein [Candidatus Izemoplasmataceae bacterium]|jgi:bacterioferritin-associated ferredoxin